jgi:hypothetical protein
VSVRIGIEAASASYAAAWPLNGFEISLGCPDSRANGFACNLCFN